MAHCGTMIDFECIRTAHTICFSNQNYIHHQPAKSFNLILFWNLIEFDNEAITSTVLFSNLNPKDAKLMIYFPHSRCSRVIIDGKHTIQTFYTNLFPTSLCMYDLLIENFLLESIVSEITFNLVSFQVFQNPVRPFIPEKSTSDLVGATDILGLAFTRCRIPSWNPSSSRLSH